MKLKQTKIKSRQLIELHLIKSRIYEQSIKKNISENITKTILNFKKSLNIIFKFHQHNKQILFIGTPQYLNTKLKQTNHFGVSPLFKTRKLQISKTLTSNLTTKDLITKNKKKPNLIVVFSDNNNSKYQNIIQEGFVYKIPTIEFSNTTQKQYQRYGYSITNHNDKKFNKNIYNIFFKIINAMFKNLKIKNDVNKKK